MSWQDFSGTVKLCESPGNAAGFSVLSEQYLPSKSQYMMSFPNGVCHCCTMNACSITSATSVLADGALLLGGAALRKRSKGSQFLAGIIARLRHAMRFQIPVGYQDETGFHFGAPGELNRTVGEQTRERKDLNPSSQI
jgi:hypothetical protein